MHSQSDLKSVTIYTDGGCVANPGPGGYGVVLLYGQYRKELSGGYRLTTNNRMELMAAIVALEALNKPCRVMLYSDSRYLVDSMRCGGPKEWQRNGWRLQPPKAKKAKNHDLWKRLLDSYKTHQVTFEWVRGHDNNRENERCDQLASEAIRQGNLGIDDVYEAHNPIEVEQLPMLQKRLTPTAGPKIQITHEGQPCRKCATPVEKRYPRKRTSKRAYHFEYYFFCPACRTMYMVEAAKRTNSVASDAESSY
jgi:ribonuclease HI